MIFVTKKDVQAIMDYMHLLAMTPPSIPMNFSDGNMPIVRRGIEAMHKLVRIFKLT
jgi:hypothetical protein